MMRRRQTNALALVAGLFVVLLGGCAGHDSQPPQGAAAQAAVAAQTAPPVGAPPAEAAAIQERIAESKARNEQAMQQRGKTPNHP